MSEALENYKGYIMSRLIHVWTGKHCFVRGSERHAEAWASESREIALPLSDSWADLRGYGQHEGGHILFSNYRELDRTAKAVAAKYQIEYSAAFMFVNLVEDLRNETLFPRLFKGSADEFHDLRMRLYDERAFSTASRNLDDLYVRMFNLRNDRNSVGARVGGEVRDLIVGKPTYLLVPVAVDMIMKSLPQEELKDMQAMKRFMDLMKKILKDAPKSASSSVGRPSGSPNDDNINKDLEKIEKQIKKIDKEMKERAEKERAEENEKNDKKRLLNKTRRIAQEAVNILRIPVDVEGDEVLKLNGFTKQRAVARYAEIMAKHGKDIQTLREELMKICGKRFSIVSNRGKLDMNRAISSVASGGRMRNIFKKKEFGRELDVVILVDESGSMAGEKCREATEAVVSFAEAMKGLGGVRLGIYGFWSGDITHSAGGDIKSSTLYTAKLKDFDEFSNVNVAALAAHSGNRDGWHLRWVENQFMKRSSISRKRLFIMISDGMPSDYAGYGDEDVKAAANEIRQDGVSLISFGFIKWEQSLAVLVANSKCEADLVRHLAKLYGKKMTVPCLAGTGGLSRAFKSVAYMIARMLGAN